MERAQTLQGPPAGTAERHVRGDDLVDASPFTDESDVVVTDPPCHLASLRSPKEGGVFLHSRRIGK
jgi:hypothetical protein